jgi:short-subunit dehydrogenase
LSRIEPSNRLVVITGVGFREGEGALGNVFLDQGVKPNIGAAVALEAASTGYEIALVARTTTKLERIRSSLLEIRPSAEVGIFPCDLLDVPAIEKLVGSLPKEKEIDLVHSAGLGAASYSLPDDNPYLRVENTPVDLPLLEYEAVVKTLLVIVKALLPVWRQQSDARAVIVSSMSGIRAVPLGFSHSSAKGGLHQAVRSLALELAPLGIGVSEVLPGIVNTGLYDSESVEAAAAKIGESFGYKYLPGCLPQMSPSAVAEAVVLCLKSSAHILSISLVSKGQFPHHGS